MKLFAKRHPRRMLPHPATNALLNAPHAMQRCQGGSGGGPTTHVLPLRAATSAIFLSLVDTPKGTRLVHVDSAFNLATHKWYAGGGLPYSFAGQQVSDFLIEPDSAAPRRLYTCGHPELQRLAAAYAVIPRTSLIVTAGHYDNSIRVFRLQTGGLLQIVSGHSRAVCCLDYVAGVNKHQQSRNSATSIE